MKTSRISTTAKVAILAIAGSVVGALSASAQIVSYTNGDLLLGVRASSGTGSATNFVFNLGASTAFRDNPEQGVVGNIGTFLSATYGSDWFSRSDVSWGVIAAWNNNNPAFDPGISNGDPSGTIYASRASIGYGTSTAWGTPTAFTVTQVLQAATPMTGFAHSGNQVNGTFAFQNAIEGSALRGAYVNSTAGSSWTAYTSPNADFTIFTGGIEQSFGGAGESSFVDLYRILATNSDPEELGTRGVGTYVSTISIDQDGLVSVGTAPIPEPSAFAALAGFAALGCAALRRRRRIA